MTVAAPTTAVPGVVSVPIVQRTTAAGPTMGAVQA
jgi:hypothetical protein